MNPVLIVGGLMLGMAGSFHCIGMCGPLSLALPTHRCNTIYNKLLSLFSYQIGRITTYSILGLLIGIAGRPLPMGEYQQFFSIGIGSLIIITALLHKRHTFHLQIPLLAPLFNKLQQFISQRITTAKGVQHFFVLGMANGWLPCGLVYVALASTFSLSNIVDSVGFMAAFGAGTLPSMLLVGISGQLVRPTLRLSLQKIVPFFMMGMGLLLILRGLNLNIPYVSPLLPEAPTTPVNCHPA